jgi:hypothetical protein
MKLPFCGGCRLRTRVGTQREGTRSQHACSSYLLPASQFCRSVGMRERLRHDLRCVARTNLQRASGSRVAAGNEQLFIPPYCFWHRTLVATETQSRSAAGAAQLRVAAVAAAFVGRRYRASRCGDAARRVL